MSSDARPTVWTIAALLKSTTDYLQGKGVEGPRLEAQQLLAHVMQIPKIQLYVKHDSVPSDEQRAALRDLVRRRAEGVPAEYLVGTAEFYQLPFVVTPDVLIPREDTGVLVLEALTFLRDRPAPRALDVGTGSGAVAVAVAHRNKQVRVLATDVSPAALAVARRNAEANGVADRVAFAEGDLLAAVPARETFDVILSNPPYIAHDEFPGLDRGVRDHEPRLALDGGPDGLAFYRRLAADAGPLLVPGGRLLLEIGYTQNDAVRGILEAAGWDGLATYRDGQAHPRVVGARRPASDGA